MTPRIKTGQVQVAHLMLESQPCENNERPLGDRQPISCWPLPSSQCRVLRQNLTRYHFLSLAGLRAHPLLEMEDTPEAKRVETLVGRLEEAAETRRREAVARREAAASREVPPPL